ncbi:S49 family peptidase [Paroceanicella profunda]|uniref:S49 family peptidase n=1 Tax=Paroceanicella profunda TaxID=2579971 RepID=A0A5B8FT05_9RHOB|nr:S49 family peptidase [Paroceanicella profunda]QDL91505.1 S49 family peptidase [Paroceanicella profunda]
MPLIDEIRAAMSRADLAWDGDRAGLFLAEAAAPDHAAGPVSIAQAGLTLGRGERFAVSRGVAVLPVTGILTPAPGVISEWLGWSTYAGIEQAAAELAAAEDVAAVALHVNTPGGLVLGCADAAAAIAQLAAVKPVYGVIAPLAASAGYWLVSGAREISIPAGGVAGSIGTMARASSPVGPGQSGEQAHEIRSGSARAKNPDPNTEAGMAAIRAGLDASEATFLSAVAAGRGIPEGEIRSRLSITDDPQDGGATWTGADAVARGLADRVESTAAAYARIFATHAPAPRPAAGRARARHARLAEMRARA